jgi:acyl-CoA thioester hydrolase
MTYSLTRRVSHADVDFVGELKVSALLGLLEQAAVEASAEAGYDPERYTREERVWIIRRTRLRRIVPVGGGDELEVRTAVADFRRARSLRRYEVLRRDVTVAEALTDWVYCDLRTGKPTRIPAALQEALYGADPPALPRGEPLLSDQPGDPSAMELVVQPSHLDHVRHVNNAIYASFLEDAAFSLFAARGWPLSRMLEAGGALRVVRLDAEYMKDAGEGERLRLCTWLLDGRGFQEEHPLEAHLHQVVTRAPEGEILRARSHWGWRRTPPVLGGVPQ